MTLLGFLLLLDSGDKITLKITTLLSIVMFSLLLSEIKPPSSNARPINTVYFMCVMIMSVVSVIVSILVLSLHFRNSKSYTMPLWVRKYICNYLAWLLRKKRPNHDFSWRAIRRRSHNYIHRAGVKYKLDSVMHALDENPDRRFIYVEIGFFRRWWNHQTKDMQNKVKKFVNEGRLEFISGGWCMNDEASTHYSSIIDQHSLGAEFLHEQFGECGRPKIGWQIDPFGHSREQASIFALMGFDGLFLGRIDHEDYTTRFRTKTMEMVWKASSNLDRQSWLFTGVLPNRYVPPDSFCFDQRCSNDPIMDDPHFHDYNVHERVQTFIQAAYDEAQGYATNHIIMTFGGDFHYEIAHEAFKNIDKLIEYVNAEQVNGSIINVFYSTPSCYLYALNKVDRAWTTKTDDFFPYARYSNGYWTGYFTSRATLKRYERHSNNILQATRQLNAFANLNERNNLFVLSDAMGIVQHHDAITGTETEEVAFDYAQRLSNGIGVAENVINKAYSKLLPKDGRSPPASNQFLCQLSNISQCLEIDGQERFTLTLWNPTIHPVVQHARVPVKTDYTIRDPTGQTVLSELIPVSQAIQNIPGRTSITQKQIIFKASLPALGFSTYYFEKKHGEEQKQSKINITYNEACVLQNQNIQVEFDDQGNLHQIFNLNKNISVSFINQGFYWYPGFPGNNSRSKSQASGAYIFRPLTPNALPVSQTRSITCIKTENVQTAIIEFNNWASQELSLYDGGEFVEVEWTVGPIPIDDDIGKEIIIRYDTDIASESKYYTDANGREVLERKRDYRPTWNYTVTETVSGNYYPINSRVWIKEKDRQFTVLTDRSEGGSSIQDGSIEIMVHRRLLYDDQFGVGEPLNETAYGEGLVVRGRHLLIVEPPASSARYHRVGSQRLYMHPIATFSLIEQDYDIYSAAYHQTWSALNDTLPLNVHLLTLDQLGPKDYLVRVEHYFESFEDDTYSQRSTFDLQSLFKSIGTISNTVELTLGANLPLADMKRLNWSTSDNKSSHRTVLTKNSLSNTNIMLIPMQIRTFQVTVV
ncbi:unnamed protein product [Rotaria sp. Silwood1]|nr:unnamed protein product [Rotaria sp. Silwood1]